jgi:hypothetical protein
LTLVTHPEQPPLTGPGGPSGTRAPAPLLGAAALAGVEALLLMLFALAELRSIESTKLAMGITTTLFFLVYGVGLGLSAWLLARLHSWARAPVVLAQLIQLGVAWSFRGGASTVAAAVLAVLAVLVLLGLFHPASVAALGDAEEREDEASDTESDRGPR